MSRIPILAVVAAFAVVLGRAPAAAQVPATDPAPEVDLRLGALWPFERAGSWPSMGGRLALRPWTSGTLRRISLQVSGDFRPLGGQDAYDEEFALRSRVVRRVSTFGGAIGIDLLRTRSIALEARAGAGVMRTRTLFLIDSSLGFVQDGDIWENVCPFQPFDARCSTRYDPTGVVSLAVRRDLVASGQGYVGLDYTWFTRGHHALVGTVGLRLR